jgi:hypothetical protein
MTFDQNPWSNLPKLGSSQYVLPIDLPYIKCFNAGILSRDDEERVNHLIVGSEIPEPWLGPIVTAPLFILQLNPRYLWTQPNQHGCWPTPLQMAKYSGPHI